MCRKRSSDAALPYTNVYGSAARLFLTKRLCFYNSVCELYFSWIIYFRAIINRTQVQRLMITPNNLWKYFNFGTKRTIFKVETGRCDRILAVYHLQSNYSSQSMCIPHKTVVQHSNNVWKVKVGCCYASYGEFNFYSIPANGMIYTFGCKNEKPTELNHHHCTVSKNFRIN